MTKFPRRIGNLTLRIAGAVCFPESDMRASALSRVLQIHAFQR